MTMPPGACDCHVHIYEDRYPLASTATFKPPHAPISAYCQMQQALGLQRVVLVQPTGYGTDNACLLDALAVMGNSARGVAVVPPDIDDVELFRLHEAGVRGVRFMLFASSGGLMDWHHLASMAERIAPLGWCVNLQFDGGEMVERGELIDSLPCKVVIDHIGRFMKPATVRDAPFKALLTLLERGDRWIKLSGPYESSASGPPDYADVSALARALCASHPSACLWASNWPHPNRNPAPDNAEMLAMLEHWAPDPGARAAILGANAAAAFGFSTEDPLAS